MKGWSPLLALLGCACVQAADVPPRTQLAAEQAVVRHLKDEPASLSPLKLVGLPELQVLRDLYEGLLTQGPDGKVLPGVATRWDNKDNQQFTFHLRPDARWSNGDKVKAADFVYGWRKLVDPKEAATFAWFAQLAHFTKVDEIVAGKLPPEALGVKALDEHTLQVTLSQPVPYFLSLLTHPSLSPLHQASMEQYGNQWTQPGKLVGNGAFVLSQRVVNEKLELAPNPHYWDRAHTVLTKVTFVPINQETAATNRYLAGDLHITESFPKEQYHKLMQQIPGEVHTPDQLGTYYYAFNTQLPPLNDVRVRKALSYTIDRGLIAAKVLGTGEKPAYRFTPDVTADFEPKANLLSSTSQQDLDARARVLLQEAGYGPAKPLKLTLLYNTAEIHKKMALAIANLWKQKLGAQVELTNQEWKTYLDSRQSGQFEVIRSSWVADYNDPSAFLGLWGSRHSGNMARFANARYDEILTQAAKSRDPGERARLFDEAESILQDEAPIAPIYQYTNARLIKPWLKGYPINNPEDVAYSRQLYLIKH
ncbi:peptide ABC transporter substrate-binding protein [Aeromonas salmonicida subsp. salmonicida]|uniref:Periplasmic murein peptide-binding protein n=1 Tax=Aeromonas salmonicida (strain A449) TaxID=382245 RepID=A4SRR4_AERS4|nr:ABC transporter substrate-binding protein [Aeromonas salmonicida]ABO91586.1 periplasmic murein peptide-binding protein [Aeromonas salmonicida subsp. salmonicida A449]ASI24817.1 oligopeptide ABC transporter substrate-binding protein OppA [Aeromonas salmonicida]ASI29136.1 oligopeptide ABC transporter substrate-binding protein OppA [Aeromonas salmonicida]ASI33268.1 oligopeptide ABC transporter substrate-binding protein OppA [Aeromonas salmonicida]ATD36833.1 oligopeptide ABC transporter substra